MKRRVFFQATIKYASLAGLSALTVFSIIPDIFNKKRSVKKIILGKASDIFSSNTAIVQKVNDETVIIVQNTTGEIQAFNATCTHAGCMVEWNDTQHSFHCRCHGGIFNEKGDPIAGPPKKPLRQLQVDIRTSTNEVILYLDDASM